MFDQDLLKTFVTILESGSFSVAADRVGRTPSAVSMQIKRLEQAVGRRLLVRSAHGVAPTAEGETLLLHARQVLEANEAAFDAMMGARAEKSLHLGIPDTYLQNLLLPHLRDFIASFPETTLRVTVASSQQLLQRFDEGVLHLMLTTEYQIGDERGELVHEERGLWVCAEGSPALDLNPLPLALAFEGSTYRQLAKDILRGQPRTYRVAFSSNRQQAIQLAIDSGAAVGLLPASWKMPSMRELTAEDGFSPVPPLLVRMRTKKGAATEACEWLADQIKEASRE